MSDESVRSALRSSGRLIVVEAPAGCGKTFQGAVYAREAADALPVGRPLVLTHTHAACAVFANGTKGSSRRVEIRTIDSVIGSIAAAYHNGLGLPADVAAWIRSRKDCYSEVATKVARIIERYPMIAISLARRYPVVICDEHQDSSADQHAVVMSLLR
jgi:ATP-dependent exoDNAse (exonuclease V) beta subunit